MSATRAATATQPDALAIDEYGSPGRSEWLDVDWRDHMRSVLVDGSRVCYIDIGEGPPIVFVHGLAGCWQNWLENIPHFSRGHRVIAVDLPGFGRSEMPRWAISIEGYGRFVDAFLGEIGIERAIVVGNSMGGSIAAEIAISHPSRVEKLVLVDAVGGPALRSWYQEGFGGRLLRLARLAEPFGAAALARREALVRRPRLRRVILFKLARHPERLAPELCYEVASGAGKPGFLDALRSIAQCDFSDRLPEISCPTLIVWGQDDGLIPVRDAHEYERLIPNASKVIFDDTGHLPMLERPARFNQVLEQFLASE
jgi:pimeloyl-ACP methyl ester carboxylesterase